MENEEELDNGDANVNSPTFIAAQVRERREELEMTPPQQHSRSDTVSTVQGEEQGGTYQDVRFDIDNYRIVHSYCPWDDMSPLRGFVFSPWKVPPSP